MQQIKKKIRQIMPFSAVLLMISLSSCLSAVIYVSPSGNNANSGGSWQEAKRDVQVGLNAAEKTGGEVWVQSGIYYEHLNLNGSISLYGGFQGGETLREQRNPRQYETILNGSGTGRVINVETGTQATIDGFSIVNADYGVFNAGTALNLSNCRIVGNHITGVHSLVEGLTAVNDYIGGTGGNGIYCGGSKQTILNCIVFSNGQDGITGVGSGSILVNNTLARNVGTAISLAGSGQTIANSLVVSNMNAVSGGTGVTYKSNCFFGNSGTLPDNLVGNNGNISEDPMVASVKNGDFHINPDSPCKNAGDNSCVPGALTLDMDQQARIQDGTVDIGADESDGTVPQSTPAIIRVSPLGNDLQDGSSWVSAKKSVQAAIWAASKTGGEVWVQAGVYTENIILLPCVKLIGGFAGTETQRSESNPSINTTTLDGGGNGTVVTIQSGLSLCVIQGFVIRNGSQGGIHSVRCSPEIANNYILHNLYGIYTQYGYPIIHDNIIVENDTFGIFCSYSKATVIGNTIAKNKGEGLHICMAIATVANNIIAFNGIGILVEESGAQPITNNCVFGNTQGNYQGLPDATGQNGNISIDPLFVNLDGGNYRLSAGSPCINSGDGNLLRTGWIDSDGNPRTAGSSTDMGAAVFSPSTNWPIFKSPDNFIKGSRWNLVSIPVDPSDPSFSKVFTGINIPNASMQYWDNNGDNGFFPCFFEGVSTVNGVSRGIPYWLVEPQVSVNKSLQVQGTAGMTDFVITLPAHSHSPYWIQVGTPFPTEISADSILFKDVSKRGDVWLSWEQAYSASNQSLRIIDSTAQGWDSDTSGFDRIGPSVWNPDSSDFKPWCGYWMLVMDSGQMEICFPKP